MEYDKYEEFHGKGLDIISGGLIMYNSAIK